MKYAQLKRMVEERDKEIESLHNELEKYRRFDPFTTTLQHLVPMTVEDKPHLIKGFKLLDQAMNEFSKCSDYDDDRICQARCYVYNIVIGFLVAYAEGKQLYEIDDETIDAYFANPDKYVEL